MYTLFLDLSFEVGTCALYHNGELLSAIIKPSRLFITPHLEIAEILEKQNIPLEAISVGAVANGPGSYTGLRNSIAVMKSLAYSCHSMHILPISSLIGAFPIMQKNDVNERKLFILIDDAKIGGVYAQKVWWDQERVWIENPQLINEKSFFNFCYGFSYISSYRPFSWFSEKIGQEDFCKEKYIQTVPFNFSSIYLAILDSLEKDREMDRSSFSNKERWRNISVEYLRKTQAELEFLKVLP